MPQLPPWTAQQLKCTGAGAGVGPGAGLGAELILAVDTGATGAAASAVLGTGAIRLGAVGLDAVARPALHLVHAWCRIRVGRERAPHVDRPPPFDHHHARLDALLIAAAHALATGSAPAPVLGALAVGLLAVGLLTVARVVLRRERGVVHVADVRDRRVD